jgi:hypothetical protein
MQHDLEVHHVLVGRARRHLGDHVRCLLDRRRLIEARERGEELVVLGLSPISEIARGEAVDQRVVEALIPKCLGDGPIVTGRPTAGRDLAGCRLDAQAFRSCPGDVALRIHRAGQMRVEVGSLRHSLQEHPDHRRAISMRVEPGC